MKNWTKIFIIIEFQVILILVIVVFFKTNNLESKLYNTNKFVHDALTNKEVINMNIINEEDLVIGDPDACVTMIIYSRFDCPACNDFFMQNYGLLKKEFIDSGHVKLVVRYLVHQSKPLTLFASKHAHYAHKIGEFDQYIEELGLKFPKIDTASISEHMIKIGGITSDLKRFVNDKEFENTLLYNSSKYRSNEMVTTPTLFVNNQVLVGNRRYQKIKKIIETELKFTDCR